MITAKEAQREKKMVALSSVGAAIGLTSIKIIVALLTGSLGILAEAAHSGLDLVASLMTYFAVRVADKPADATHHYGHGKVENLSAFLEAGLLLLTALWIIYEAVRRLIYHEGHVDASLWAFVVMIIAIVVDFTRSRTLLRVARKLGSQALEADALHFNTDIWSSTVVIVGLLIVRLSQSFQLPTWLGQADAFAALGVSGIVIWVSLRLAKETVDALLDRAPGAFATQVQKRVERAAMEGVHTLSPQGEVDVLVHVEPMPSPSETVMDQIHYLAELQGVHAHDIHVRKVSGKLEADFDLEVQSDMDLEEAHNVATQLEQAVLQNNNLLRRVTTHLEAPNATVVPRKDVTKQYPEMARQIIHIADEIAGKGSAHDVHLYRSNATYNDHMNGSGGAQDEELDLVLHTIFEPHIPLSQAHIQAEEIQRALRHTYPSLGSVVIHTEPPE